MNAARPRRSALVSGSLAASGLGLVALGLRAPLDDLPRSDLALALLVTTLGYATLGLVAALCARLVTRAAEPAARGAIGVAAAAFAVGAIEVGARLGEHSAHFVVLVALAAGYVAFASTRALVRRVRVLSAPWLLGAPLIAWAAVLAGTALERSGDGGPAAAVPPGTPSVLLITIDTLRADFVGAYGDARARTPVIDDLAARGTRFESATAHSIITGPSHLSILSGLTPQHHGVLENSLAAGDDIPILADRLRSAGVETAAFVSGAPVRERDLGILSRFDHYDDDFRSFGALPDVAYETGLGQLLQRRLAARGVDFSPYSRPADALNAVAIDWLDDRKPGPFFVWAHYYDPHLPYEAPDRFLTEEVRRYEGPARGDWYRAGPEARRQILRDPAALAQMARLYRAEIAHVDEQLGKLVARAQASVGDGALWVIVTADHGEAFGEHGFFFWRDLYEPTLRVPLIVTPPASVPHRPVVSANVGLADVAPTVLAILGFPVPPRLDGVSLLPLLSGEHVAPREIESVIAPSRLHPWGRRHWSVRSGRYKAILRETGWARNQDHRWLPEMHELYDLEVDPEELHDLAGAQPEVHAELVAGLPTGAELGPDELPAIDREAREMLKALGYAR